MYIFTPIYKRQASDVFGALALITLGTIAMYGCIFYGLALGAL